MKTLLKLFSLTCALLIFSFISVNAQTVYFCESVSDDGYPKNSSSSFTINSGGGYLDVLVDLGYTCETDHIYMDFYRIDRNGKEVFDSTIEMDVDPDWTWFYKEVTFYDSGRYVVYVADEDGYPLANGEVKISFR